MRKIGWMGLVVAVGLSLPVLAHAQSGVVVGGSAGGGDENPAVLERQAQALFPVPKKYGEAAKLYVRAAELRLPGDPQRVTDLMMASRLKYYDGDGRAWTLMERAAEEAIAAGDVIGAAHAFVDASFLAQEAGENAVVLDLVERAELLTHSPLLETEQREAILARIGLPADPESRRVARAALRR